MPDMRTLKVQAYYVIAIVPPIAALFALRPVFHAQGLAMLLAMAACVAWGLIFAGLAWRRTDETAQEAHKFAYFWGASFGMLALFLAAPFALAGVFHQPVFPPPPRPGAAWTPTMLVMFGITLAALAQTIGYALVWAGWWLRRR